ncbi:MAG: hypothetical protein ACE5RN_02385 [Nitrosopumilaceae archaeon]
MPGQGYSTIGLKPVILEKLHSITDEFFPGMFLPSTLIIMMNEIKRGYYTVNSHDLRLNLEGNYNSITIRSDVKLWLEENYNVFGEEYKKKYRVKSFANFLSYFLVNLFQSKVDAQNHVIKLKASDFKWLIEEYKKQQTNQKNKNDIQTFEQFASDFLKELLNRVNEAKKILTS